MGGGRRDGSQSTTGTPELESWAPHSSLLLTVVFFSYEKKVVSMTCGPEELWVGLSFCSGVSGEVSCNFLHVRALGNVW